MKIQTIALLLTVLMANSLVGQTQRFSDNDGEAWYGGGVIANQQSISGIYSMLVNGAVFAPTPYEERKVNAIGGTFWTRFGAPYSDFFIEGQFSFLSNIKTTDTLEGGHFYLENETGLKYKILFDRDYINFGLFPGWFLPFPNRDQSALGVYLTAGLVWSITSGNSIDYQSNESQFDLGVEAALEQGIKFRNDFLFMPGAGIQFKLNDNIALEGRYNQGWGLSDIFETQNNPYFWREQENKTRIHHQLALTCLVRFDN